MVLAGVAMLKTCVTVVPDRPVTVCSRGAIAPIDGVGEARGLIDGRWVKRRQRVRLSLPAGPSVGPTMATVGAALSTVSVVVAVLLAPVAAVSVLCAA